MNKKKIITCVLVCIVVLAIGVTIGFFIGKDKNEDVSAEITTTEEVTDAPSETENPTEESTTEETTQETTTEETTTETTTKAAKYTEADEIVYATSDVNVRTGPGTNAKILGAIKKGNSIKRTAIGDNGWSKVSYNGKTAYVFSKYLTKTSLNSNGVDMCGISNTDAKNLTDLLEYIFFYGSKSYEYNTNVDTYDYKANNAFEKAFAKVYGASFYNFSELVSSIYRLYYENEVVFPLGDENDMTDPRGYWTQFGRTEAEFIDFILENMFNVKPDHSYVLKEKGWEGETIYLAYYEDGYYYSDAGDGGDGCGPDVVIKKVEILPDGKYQITVHYRIVEAGENNEMVTFIDGRDINVIAEMKNIDGNSIWSFYEIKEVK